jgi:hypothetical protein
VVAQTPKPAKFSSSSARATPRGCSTLAIAYWCIASLSLEACASSTAAREPSWWLPANQQASQEFGCVLHDILKPTRRFPNWARDVNLIVIGATTHVETTFYEGPPLQQPPLPQEPNESRRRGWYTVKVIATLRGKPPAGEFNVPFEHAIDGFGHPTGTMFDLRPGTKIFYFDSRSQKGIRELYSEECDYSSGS